jgi:ectoine hydroxylase-related dioxygenase (phytanoyl-CoA dioxygenase family)
VGPPFHETGARHASRTWPGKDPALNVNKISQQLEEYGYVVIPRFLDEETTTAIRSHIDRLAPPVSPRDQVSAPRLHTLRHPIPGAIMARLLADNTALIPLAASLLGTRDVADLRLLEQVLIRTDPGPHPAAPTGWHVDMAFFPDQYGSRPRRTYYHMVHACSTVRPGGGAFMIIPGSHHRTYAVTATLPRTDAALEAFKNSVLDRAGCDPTREAIEVCPDEGDLLVFNPMCIHSASRNVRAESRYVYFTSFFDTSATWLRQRLDGMHYRSGFPDSLRQGMPEALARLLD